MEERLQEKLDDNFAVQNVKWQNMRKSELIDNVEEITAVKAAYYYLTEEFEFDRNMAKAKMILEMADPLQTVAEAMLDSGDLSNICGVIDNLMRTEKIMQEEVRFRAMDFAEENRTPRPSILTRLQGSVSALTAPKPRAARYSRGEER